MKVPLQFHGAESLFDVGGIVIPPKQTFWFSGIAVCKTKGGG